MRISSTSTFIVFQIVLLLFFAQNTFGHSKSSSFEQLFGSPQNGQDTIFESICNGDSLLLINGTYATVSGFYSNTYTASSGLDSIVYIQLTILPAIVGSQSVAICPGDTFWFDSVQYSITDGSFSFTYTAANGCDSVVQTQISFLPSSSDTISTFFCGNYTLPNGQIVSQTGNYTISYTNAFGCDSNKVYSVVIVNTFDFNYTLSICEGTTAVIQGPNNIAVSAPGVYVDSALTNGCLVFLITTVTVRPSYFNSNVVHICPGDSYMLQNGTSVFSSGTYGVTFTTVGGCDSVFQTTVVVDSFSIPITAVDLCAGDSLLLPSGKVVSSAGIHQDTLSSVLGCDSILQFNVSLRPVYGFQNSVTICVNDSVILPSGTVVNQTGVYYDTLSTTFGCDSVIETSVQTVNSFTAFVSTQMCQGDTLTLPSGNLVLTGGTYYDTLQSVALCDSIIVFSITEYPIYTFGVTDTVHLCVGDTLFLNNGTFLTTTSFFSQTLQSINGCDSSFNSLALFWPNSSTNQSFIICQGDSVQLPNGVYSSTSGTFNHILSNQWGCDSVVTSNISIENNGVQQVNYSFCPGGTFTLPSGLVVSQPGIYPDTISSALGCDSVLSVQLSEFPAYNLFDTASICQGESYMLPDGTSVNNGGVYLTPLQTVEGCDSTINTTVIIDSVQFNMVQDQQQVYAIASGATYQWLNCATGHSIIPGETDSSFIFTGPGSFAVEITQNGCLDTSTCFLSNFSISELSENTIIVYPNPGQGFYNVRLSQTATEIRAVVLNSIGQLVHEEIFFNTDSFSFELEGPAGIYLLQIHTPSTSQSFNLVMLF